MFEEYVIIQKNVQKYFHWNERSLVNEKLNENKEEEHMNWWCERRCIMWAKAVLTEISLKWQCGERCERSSFFEFQRRKNWKIKIRKLFRKNDEIPERIIFISSGRIKNLLEKKFLPVLERICLEQIILKLKNLLIFDSIFSNNSCFDNFIFLVKINKKTKNSQKYKSSLHDIELQKHCILFSIFSKWSLISSFAFN